MEKPAHLMIPAPLREAFLSVGIRDQMDDLRRAVARAPAAAAWPCGQVSDDNSAIVGRDGWLFLNGGHNHWSEQAAGQFTLTPHGCELWTSLLQRRRDRMQRRGIRYAHLFAPEKVCVYPELHPAATPLSPQRPVMQIMSQQGAEHSAVHYPAQALRAGKTLAPTYYRGNSHWTWFGAWLACQELWLQLGIPVREDIPATRQYPVQHVWPPSSWVWPTKTTTSSTWMPT